MTATVADNEELLRVEGVRKAFGQVVALKNAQFSLKEVPFTPCAAGMAPVNPRS